MSQECQREQRLQDKVAIVTGGASGIGREICLEFASNGASVAIADLNRPNAESVAKTIGERGSVAMAVEVDIRDAKQVAAAVAETVARFGTVDILVNCAGWNMFKPLEELAPEEWEKIRSINLDGSWFFSQAVVPEMKKKRSGKIINVGSAAGILAIPKTAAYSIAKHGVIGLTRTFAVDLGPHGITVNCVCPTSVDTPLLMESTTPEFRAEMTRRIPLRRLGKVSDMAKACLFLASSDADFISGVVLPVDGGLTCCLRGHHYGDE